MLSRNSSKDIPENWQEFSSQDDIKELILSSNDHPVWIFKHSTRCPISSRAYSEMEKVNDTIVCADCTFVYVDVIAQRSVSNAIADQLNVQHQSPQLILLYGGEVKQHLSHGAINGNIIEKQVTV